MGIMLLIPESSKNNSSLPNITTNSHYGSITEDKKIVNSESGKKLISKYKIINNNGNNGESDKVNINTINNKKNDTIKNNYNSENKKIIIKTENSIPTVTNNNTIKKPNYKEGNHSTDHEVVNNMPTHRLYQTKKGIVKKDKDFLRYLEGLGGGILYSKYAKQIEGNKYNNRNRVNMYYKSSNKNNQYLPNIFKNKSNNSVNKYGIRKK